MVPKALKYKTKNYILMYEIKKDAKESYISILGFSDYLEHDQVIIPSTIKGLPVRKIARKAFSQTPIRGINFSEGLISIEAGAFSDCHNLREVVFPNSLEVINESAFDSCIFLENIKLNEGLKTIGPSAFIDTKIENLTIPDSVSRIEEFAFYRCGLKNVKCGAGLEFIGECAFCENENLEKVDFNEGLQKIAAEAFDSSGLKSAILPDSLKNLAFSAFNYCHSLTFLYLGANLENTTYLNSICSGCSSLETIIVSKDNNQFKSINNILYDTKANKLVKVPSNIKEMTIPRWVEAITPSCFVDVRLEKLYIRPKSLKNIDESCMRNAKTIYCVPNSAVHEKVKEYSEVNIVTIDSKLTTFLDALTPDEHSLS